MHRKVRDLHTDNETCLVAMRPGETPVPFPNTMVKTRAADDTVPETVRESRWLPDSKKTGAAETSGRLSYRKLVLPVIRGSGRPGFLMADKAGDKKQDPSSRVRNAAA